CVFRRGFLVLHTFLRWIGRLLHESGFFGAIGCVWTRIFHFSSLYRSAPSSFRIFWSNRQRPKKGAHEDTKARRIPCTRKASCSSCLRAFVGVRRREMRCGRDRITPNTDMTRPLLLCASFLALTAAALSVRPFGTSTAAAQSAALRWYKGNTHTHTLNSDGDSTPDEVARWYREHGYQFLVLTDHNVLTRVDGLNSILGADDQFLIVKGEEVSDRIDGKPIHINGLDVSERVEPEHGSSVSAVIQANLDAIRRAGGIPHVNHPNFQWAISADDLQRVEREKLFEIYNGHPEVNNLGGGGVPGMEE